MKQNDSTIFESAQREYAPVLVKLSGEFDIRYRRTIKNTLRDCLASGRSTLVDLSEVTFMDSRCVWELAVYYQLGRGRIVLCDPSRHVGVSVAACDLEDWLDFIYTTDSRLSPGCAAGSISQNAARKRRKAPMHKSYTAVSPKDRGGSTATTEEYAGYTACDPRGQKIGRIERIFLNGRGEPEYIKVKMGYFGFKSILIPVLSVATDEERRTLLLQ